MKLPHPACNTTTTGGFLTFPTKLDICVMQSYDHALLKHGVQAAIKALESRTTLIPVRSEPKVPAAIWKYNKTIVTKDPFFVSWFRCEGGALIHVPRDYKWPVRDCVARLGDFLFPFSDLNFKKKSLARNLATFSAHVEFITVRGHITAAVKQIQKLFPLDVLTVLR